MSAKIKSTAAVMAGGEPLSLSQRLREKAKDGIIAVSAANLCFVTAWFNTLYDKDSYFNKLPVGTPQLLALLENIFWLSAIIWVVIRVRRRAQSRLSKLFLDLVFVGLLLIPANFIRYDIFQIWDYQLITFFKQPVVMCGMAVAFAVLLMVHEQVARLARGIMAIFSPLVVLVLGKSILLLLGVIHLDQQVSQPVLPPLRAEREGQPRVVWIIFDSADYRLMFENRPSGVQLPEFDRLRNESLSAVHAISPDNCTIASMPALISGHQLSAVKPAGLSDLDLTLADSGKKTTWKALPSIFSEARALGVNTALVGWYHPYGRLFANDLNYCQWYPFPAFEPERAVTFGKSMEAQIGCLFFTPHARHIYLDVCLNSLNDSLSLVTNKAYGLVFLHLPPPHTPGIYLPKENRFTYWPMTRVGGYFNNLCLADHELGRLRYAMETFGQWDKSWVIISADHSAGQAALYDGKLDPRIPFIVKPPGANFGTSYSPGINTVLTHDLVLAVLRGQVTNMDGAVTWLDGHGKPLPAIEVGESSN